MLCLILFDVIRCFYWIPVNYLPAFFRIASLALRKLYDDKGMTEPVFSSIENNKLCVYNIFLHWFALAYAIEIYNRRMLGTSFPIHENNMSISLTWYHML